MEVKPYHQEGSKKAQVGQMFDNIAPKYDLLNRVLSMGIDVQWRKRMMQELRKTGPQRILDVATGTADVALQTAKTLEPRTIIGVDLSNEMLRVGREKVKKQGLSEVITLEQGDSEELRFADDSFDAVTVAFGVRNYENLERGLREMLRVLKPGGKIAILEFSKPKAFPFRQLYNFYFRHILPTIGRLTSKDPRAYTYLYESVQAFPDGTDFLREMENAGYVQTKQIPLTLGISSIYVGNKA